MFLVDIATLKVILGYAASNNAYDAELQLYAEAAEAAVEKYCDRSFESQEYTHYFSGNNQQKLALRQTPVSEVASVYVDSYGYFGLGSSSPFSSLARLTEGVEYVLDVDSSDGVSKSGILWRIGAVWPVLNRVLPTNRLAPEIGPAVGNIKVTYTAGYDSPPADLKMATAMVAVNMRQMAKRGGDKVKSERIGDYSYELFDRLMASPEAGSVRATLSRYKEYGW